MEIALNRFAAFVLACVVVASSALVTNHALAATVYDHVDEPRSTENTQTAPAETSPSQAMPTETRPVSSAERPSAAAMLVDLPVRILGLVAIGVGAITWVVTLPFSATGGNVEEAGSSLVGDPFRFTFQRPLGVFPR